MEPLQQVANLAPIVKGVVAGANDYVDGAGGRILGRAELPDHHASNRQPPHT